MTKAKKSLCIYALICCVLATTVGAKVLPKAAQLCPPETVFLIEVDNFSQLRTQFEKTRIYKLYKDPAMAPFFEDLKTKWLDKIKTQKNDLLEAILNAEVLPEGKVAAAIVMNQKSIDANEPMFLIISQWGQNLQRIKEIINKTVEKAIDDGANRKLEDYRGANIKTIIVEGSTDAGSQTISYCFVDDCLIASEDIDIIKFALAHLKGATSPTLSDTSDYTTTMKSVGPYHDIDLYVNINQILKILAAEDSTGKTRMWINTLGFDNVTSFACAIACARQPRNSCSAKAILKINGSKKGVCKMLEAQSAPLKVPRFIPSATYSATFFNWSLKNAIEELGKIQSQFTTILYMPIPVSESPDDPPLILKRDIIDHLGSGLIVAQSLNKPFSKERSPTEYLFALTVNDRDTIEKSLSLLHSKMIAPNDPDATRQLLGHTIYLVDSPGLPFMRGKKIPMQDPLTQQTQQSTKMAFTITDTHLIFGLESTVERAIRVLSNPSADSFSSAKWFNKASSALPSVTGLSYLEDSAASAELLWWMFKPDKNANTSSASSGQTTFPFGPVKIKEYVNFELLPDYEAVRKYFGLSVTHGISRDDGFFFEFKTINPAAK